MSHTVFSTMLFLVAFTVSSNALFNEKRSSSKVSRKHKCQTQAPLICSVVPTAGYNTTGTVTFKPVFIKKNPLFMKKNGGFRRCVVHVVAKISGLTPGRHGFHIHTFGDILKSDGTSTGGHFLNLDGTQVSHGFPLNTKHHWGDLGNLGANAAGTAWYNRIDRVITLQGVVGRGMTLHADEDKGRNSQPTGGAGARIGFCVIGFANPDLL